jgi:hypothetical protein
LRIPTLLSIVAALSFASPACTLHHSKQALWTPAQAPASEDARFVTEEDSGLMLLGVFMLSEPDHYAVLLERVRREHRCRALHHAQLDFFTDHWLIISFPISRVTLICEPELERGAAPGEVGRGR